MKDKIEIKGYWFLPDNPKNQIAGILNYLPNERITLELIGSFQDPIDFLKSNEKDKMREVDIVLGESSDSRKITLINCRSSQSFNYSCSFSMQVFNIQFVLRGMHVNDYKQEIFNSITLRLPQLTKWVNNYRLKYSIPFKSEVAHGFSLGYNLDESNIINAELDDSVQMKIEYVCYPPSDTYQEQIKVTQVYQLSFNTKDNWPFHKLLRLGNKFCDFLSLATFYSIDYNKITFRSPVIFQELNNGRKIFHPIDFYFIQDNIPVQKASSSDYLFDHNIISSAFEDIMRAWYKLDQTMVPILQHLIDSIQPKTYFSKADFLVVIQALEGFHTRFRKRTKMNLMLRLKDLHNEFSFIPSIANMKIDFQIAVDSRHYYSHFFHKDEKEHIADGEELYYLTKDLKVILICCILKETGFNNDIINNVINGNKKIFK